MNSLNKIVITLCLLYLTNNLHAQTYCWPSQQMACFYGDKITRVVFAGINHTDAACSVDGDGKKDFTGITSAQVLKGNAYTLSVTVENSISSGTERLRAWLDFNDNGTFEASESFDLGVGTGNTTLTTSITIPNTATVGVTRLRIMYRRTSSNTLNATDACHSYGSYRGQVKDYPVQISVAGLPIELVSFDAILKDREVHLNWMTASEINNQYFSIEHLEGDSWISIATVNGAGNSSNAIAYKHVDKNPNNNTNYYRLKQTDFDGTSTYSKIVSVRLEDKIEVKSNVYPNPFSNYLIVNTNAADPNILLTNAIGQNVNIIQHAENENQTIIETQNLPEGVYFLNINNKNFRLIKK